MPDLAADPAPDHSGHSDAHDGRASEYHTAGRLAWLAGAACVACCALPALVAAGLLGGGALAVAAWLPTLAVVLAVAAVVVLGWTWRRRSHTAADAHGCGGEACGCGSTEAVRSVVDVSVRS